jgi:hypothetical protein
VIDFAFFGASRRTRERLARPLHTSIASEGKTKIQEGGELSQMSIQKKSLISTLKTAKKANVASTHETDAKGAKIASMRMQVSKGVTAKSLKSAKAFNARSFKSTKISLKSVE